MPKEWWVLAGFLTLCFSCQALASYYTVQSVYTGYLDLKKPDWMPALALFDPIWTFLYALMALSGWFMWRVVGKLARAPFAFGSFLIQLILITLWPILFFYRQSIQLGLIDILFVLIFVAMTMYFFWRSCPISGYLLLPYLACVVFGIALNTAVVLAN